MILSPRLPAELRRVCNAVQGGHALDPKDKQWEDFERVIGPISVLTLLDRIAELELDNETLKRQVKCIATTKI